MSSDKVTLSLSINGKSRTVSVFQDTPLLWVIREQLQLTGTKFGCGAGMCGACTVHLDGKAALSCQIPAMQAMGKKITTIEGLAPASDHPVQKAWVAEQVPQCGYCQSGQIMRAAAMLKESPNPSREQIVQTMTTNVCRCGSYHRIIKAVERVVHGVKA